MLPIDSSRSLSRRRNRLVPFAALVAVGCGSSGGGCAGSCGGAWKTIPAPQLTAAKSSRLDNVAQLRVTQSGFNFLNETHLNQLIGNLNGASGGLGVPCVDLKVLTDTCFGNFGLHFSAIAGDTNFNGVCDAGETTPVHITFRKLTWGLDPTNQQLKAHLVAHIETGDIYLHTKEAHDTLCNGPVEPIQARLYYNDELPGAAQQDTTIDLALRFSTAPDGRLELNVNQDSLNSLIAQFNPGAIGIDGFAGTDPTPPLTGHYSGDGCDASNTGTYAVTTPNTPNNDLNCSAVFRDIALNCPDPGAHYYCPVYFQLRDHLLNYLKTTFAPQIVGLLRTELDKVRCEGAYDGNYNPIACDSAHACPSDDDGHLLLCDSSRGVCGQSATTPANFDCEPTPLGTQGLLDLSGLTEKAGFPANTQLQVFAGLGSKHAEASVDPNGIQLSVQAGTAPAGGAVSLCVPPAFPATFTDPPALNFDDPANKPVSVTDYQLGFSVASQMLNRLFYDGYSSGLMCIALTNQTTPFISTSLFKTFLPSLGLVTGGRDVPMQILLRPSQPPLVRIGKGDLTATADGTVSVGPNNDPLVTLSFSALNLDFYGLIDERQVRLFTLQTDMLLPLSLRIFASPNQDTLVPVLGSLDAVLSNIKASNSQMLAEDPGAIKDLLGAAIKLAEPLLAGILKPITLPRTLGLDLQVAGLQGVVPLANLQTQGYAHLATYLNFAECTGGITPCGQLTVRTEARIASRSVPEDADAVRAGQVPSVVIEGSAHSAHVNAVAQFSYRLDGGLWFPWVAGPRFTVQDRRFLFPGHHQIEVVAREAGDDRSADPAPVPLDFFVSIDPPKVELVQRANGSLFTRASSPASPGDALLFSYRIDGESGWTEPGAARVFTAAEQGGRGFSVSVSDEGGRATVAHYGELTEADQVAQASLGGCSTSSRAVNWVVLWLALVLVARKLRGRYGQ